MEAVLAVRYRGDGVSVARLTCSASQVSVRLAMYLPLLPILYASPVKSGLSWGAAASNAQFQ